MKHANVAIFVPHCGCPHQCSFCNQRGITGQAEPPTPEAVRSTAQGAKKELDGFPAELAFFGGSFTAIDRPYLISLLETAFPFVQDGTFTGIRVSTRPDAIDGEILQILREYGVSAIELGAQSMDDRVLRLNRRGHTAAQVEQSSRMIREQGFSLGLQMMTGLYGDTAQGAAETAESLAALSPDNVRIYPAIVLEHTDLADWYRAGTYSPMDLDATVTLCAGLLELFAEREIPVIRLGLHDTPELHRDMLAGPYHPAFGELCQSALYLRYLLAAFHTCGLPKGRVTVFIHAKDMSRAVGQKKKNLASLEELGYQVSFCPQPQVPLGAFVLYDQRREHNLIFYRHRFENWSFH